MQELRAKVQEIVSEEMSVMSAWASPKTVHKRSQAIVNRVMDLFSPKEKSGTKS